MRSKSVIAGSGIQYLEYEPKYLALLHVAVLYVETLTIDSFRVSIFLRQELYNTMDIFFSFFDMHSHIYCETCHRISYLFRHARRDTKASNIT
jgi:hypothetical protein